MCDKCCFTEAVRYHLLSLLPYYAQNQNYAQNQKMVGVKTMVNYDFTVTAIFIFLTMNAIFLSCNFIF